MTNAERIRKLSDKELASFMRHCPTFEITEKCLKSRFAITKGRCTACWLKWLQQEVKE